MTLIPGSIGLTGAASPKETTEQFPTLDPLWGIDGHRSVATIAERNAITSLRRRFGMTVSVNADPTPSNNKTYKLSNIALGGVNDTLTDNTNWVEIVGWSEEQTRNTPLTSLNIALTGPITSSDNIIQAFGKIQNKITSLDFGIAWKDPVVAMTTTNITLSGEQTINTVLTSTDRVAVNGQTDATQNGIYVTGAGAWTRAIDADSNEELLAATFRVLEGDSVNGNKTFNNPTSPVELGSTEIHFVEINDAINYVPGNLVNITGNVIALAAINSGRIIVGNASNVGTAVLMSGDATLSNTGAITLANTGVSPGAYTNVNLTVDSKGRITVIEDGVEPVLPEESSIEFTITGDGTTTDFVLNHDFGHRYLHVTVIQKFDPYKEMHPEKYATDDDNLTIVFQTPPEGGDEYLVKISNNAFSLATVGTGTVTSINATVTPSTALTVTGGPITSSGTLAFAWTGADTQLVRGDGTLATIPSAITVNNNANNRIITANGGTTSVEAETNLVWDGTQLGVGLTTPHIGGILHAHRDLNGVVGIFSTNDNAGVNAGSSIRVGIAPTDFINNTLSMTITGQNFSDASYNTTIPGYTSILESNTSGNFAISTLINNTSIDFYTFARQKRMSISAPGEITISNLAGTGQRAVVASSTGVLSTVRANRTLAAFFADAPGGSGVDADMFSYTIPANTFTTNGDSISAIYTGINDGTDGLNFSFNGTKLFAGSDGWEVDDNDRTFVMNVLIVRVSSSVARVTVSIVEGTDEYTDNVCGGTYQEITSVDWTAGIIIKLTALAVATVAKSGIVEFKPAP